MIDLVGVGTLNFDRVGRQLGIKTESVIQVLGNEFRVDFPLRVETEQRSSERLQGSEMRDLTGLGYGRQQSSERIDLRPTDDDDFTHLDTVKKILGK